MILINNAFDFSESLDVCSPHNKALKITDSMRLLGMRQNISLLEEASQKWFIQPWPEDQG